MVFLAGPDRLRVSYAFSNLPWLSVALQVLTQISRSGDSVQPRLPRGRGAMSYLFSRNQVRIGIGAILLLLIQAFIAPRPSWAGCNPLVGSSTHPARSFAHLDDLITTGNPSMIQSHRAVGLPARSGPGRPAPCSGPSCSGRIPLPVSTATTGFANPDQWGVVGESLDMTRSPGRVEYHDDEPPCHSGGLLFIFHPPRSSS